MAEASWLVVTSVVPSCCMACSKLAPSSPENMLLLWVGGGRAVLHTSANQYF